MQGYYPPDDLLSKSQGSTQVLPNGNVLVNWGSEGAMTEFLLNGTAIFHAYMDSGYLGLGVENYRAYRYNWTGLPNEEPAIAAFEDVNGTSIYVSWNGDTETKRWSFFEIDRSANFSFLLGEVERTSFETGLRVWNRTVKEVFAEAVDDRGVVLRSTRVTPIQPAVNPSSKGLGGGVQYQTTVDAEQDVL